MKMPISIKEIDLIVNNLPKKVDGLGNKFYQTFKEGIRPIFINLSQKIEAEKILPNSSY